LGGIGLLFAAGLLFIDYLAGELRYLIRQGRNRLLLRLYLVRLRLAERRLRLFREKVGVTEGGNDGCGEFEQQGSNQRPKIVVLDGHESGDAEQRKDCRGGEDSKDSVEKMLLHGEREQWPNDPKLSDGGGWRGGCAGEGGGAAAVTAGAVRCSAWLAVAGIRTLTLMKLLWN
jgi:hypothetical protein